MKILVLSHIFMPSDGPASARITYLSNYLSLAGNQVTVITPDIEGSRVISLDPKLLHIKIGRVAKRRNSKKKVFVKKIIQSAFNSNCIKSFDQIFMRTSEGKWCKNIMRYMKSNWHLFRNTDLVITSYPGRSAVILGSFFKQNSNASWLLDYRDLWSLNHYTTSTQFEKNLLISKEKKVLSIVDMATYASKGFLKDNEAVFGNNIPSAVIYNGYIGSIRQKDVIDKKNEQIVMAYAGTLYGGKRNLNAFYDYMLLNPTIIFDIAVFDLTDKIYAESLSKKYGLENRVQVRLNIPFVDAIKMLKNADCLALIFSDDGIDLSYPTAKLFEYFQMNKQILTNATQHHEGYKIMRDVGVGEMLCECAKKPIEKILCVEANLDMLKKYSREYQCKKLSDFIEKNI